MSKTVRFSEDSLIMIKNRLNEVMVGTDGVSHNDVSVKLYHGTTVDALLIIMESGIMSAKRGRQNGETYGMNWFSLKEGDNFNRGALFSIEVPSDEFSEKFNMMNNSEAVSKDDELDISAYNLKIEKICGMSSGAIKRSYERYVKEGESYPLERVGNLFDYFMDEVQDNETMFPNLLFRKWEKYFPMIMKNILGENINESVNEAAPEVDVYEIGGEENAPVGGQYFHEKKIEEATLNLPQGLIEFLMKNKPDKFSNWVVFDFNNLSTYPRYFQKRQTAYDFYKWMKMDYNCKPKLLNLDKINNAVNESYNVSVRGDLDSINTIEFIPHENAREEGYTDDELEDFEPYYEIEAMDMNGDTILYADLTVDELFDYFPQSIINDIVERDNSSSARLSNPSINQYRIEDILYRDTTPSDANDVDEVNRIAKKIQTGGPSAYLLTDGDIISFQDHIYITSIDGITPDKFMALGNIRLTNGGFELIKEPTREQMRELKRWIRGMNSGIHVDFCEESHGTYPRTLFSTSYISPNAERIVNDIYYYFEEGVKPQDNFYESKDSEMVVENGNFEVKSSEIDLSSFKKKHELVPNIWNPSGKLNSRIRLKLLDIADDFWKCVNLTWVKPRGIILTGSICNFNWSQYSDIDLHLIVDFNEIDEKTEFVRDYLDVKKNEWNNEHKGLQIMGYQVELYVQNVGEMPESNGIYDLEENDWIKEPNPDDIKPIRLNKFSIKDKAAKIMTIIDDMYDALAATDDSYEIEQMGDDADYLWKKVKEMRKSSLEKHGESGSGNIVYKILRRTGYLDRLWKLSNVVYDKTNSITESANVEDVKKLSVTEGARYDIFRNNQVARYKVIGEMAEDGYVFHGTGEDGNGTEWDTVDPTRIKGGSRGTYGYGIYFTAHAYKCEKYTTYTDGHYIIANINGFNIINLRDKIDKNRNIFLKKQREYYLLQNELDRARNNKEYDEISSWIEEYNNTVDKDLLNAIIQVISESDENDLTYFYLNNHIPLLWYSDGNPDKQLSKLYLSLGIDGFEFDTEYVLFNFELLNHAIVKDKEALIAKYMQKNIEWFKEKNIHVDESVKKYITVLKEEFALDGSSNSNPYEKRWENERKVLKDFICNNGVLMQSREDNKQGKLYKCFTDTWLSNLIGYNYCLCVQWDEIKMKPKSVVYIRALDKFTPNIKRNIQFDNRGFDNVRGTYDDVRNY